LQGGSLEAVRGNDNERSGQMSFAKMDQVFPEATEQAMPLIIAGILRDEYAHSGAAVKKIGREIKVNPRTVKNWYEGHCSPNLTHFIRLARLSPKLLESFLVVCGYEDVARGLAEQNNDQYRTWDGQNVACCCINFDTKNTFLSGNSLRQLKQRQLWFYAEVQLGHKPTARSLTEFWSISIATARRDIALLTRLRLIDFAGAKRYGFYAALPTHDDFAVLSL
jgi:hypothetical protein